MSSPYDDILHLPHHRSTVHPPLSSMQRAAQFAPFAALTGHKAAIEEAARLTEARIELDDERKFQLNQQLLLAADSGKAWQLTWFVADSRKTGGAYRTQLGTIRRLDEVHRFVELTDRTRIPIDDLVAIHPAESTHFEVGEAFRMDGF